MNEDALYNELIAAVNSYRWDTSNPYSNAQKSLVKAKVKTNEENVKITPLKSEVSNEEIGQTYKTKTDLYVVASSEDSQRQNLNKTYLSKIDNGEEVVEPKFYRKTATTITLVEEITEEEWLEANENNELSTEE